MNEPVNPREVVNNLKAGGYTVEIEHYRRYKVVWQDGKTGKILTKVELYTTQQAWYVQKTVPATLMELLPTGGTTLVCIAVPKSDTRFSSSAVCRNDENYNKKTGVKTALIRIERKVWEELTKYRPLHCGCGCESGAGE